MCGIIGYVGTECARDKLINGLKSLEYRGYDSCGIATKEKITKTQGRVSKLEELLKNDNDTSTMGIGHTRWATHGEANEINAHPHKVGKITLVHNGIIENYEEIKSELQSQGVKFVSETDTEVACALINHYYEGEGDVIKAISKARQRFEGSFALAIMVEGESKIYLVRHKSPLIIGKSDNGYYLASDLSALCGYAKEYYRLKENEEAMLSQEGAFLFNSENPLPVWEIYNFSEENDGKNGYSHFMLKEIYQQGEAICKTIKSRIKNSLPDFENDKIPSGYFKDFDSVQIIGCGSAMHAGLLGKHMIEKYGKIPVSVYVASEYRYNPPIVSGNTLCIFISQSGETADTYASLEYARSKGYKCLAVVNKKFTVIANEADKVIYTEAGNEIAVATTKGYTTQVAVLSLVALRIAYEKSATDETTIKRVTHSLENDVVDTINAVLEKREEIRSLAVIISTQNQLFYIGRGYDYFICKEGSLKLKEISYINSSDYPAGELKHGTISLITNKTPVIAIANDIGLLIKTVSNLKETKARGAFTVLVTSLDVNEEISDHVFKIDAKGQLEAIFGSVIFIQLLAYEVALLRGCDIDKPRNLAKSVTVE